MEQAVNQFNKGLQCDTHPMVQGNDVLSDALNATFVTMNGNEVVLQNDMGNRRVDNAYLPAGYEPVGIKEYGGVIYIAAYNPITNRSQIGSFPSPERRIGVHDDENLGTDKLALKSDLSDYSFKHSPEESLAGLECLDKDVILYPLTNDSSLHAGDKFIIYTNDSSPFEDVSNYRNIDSSGKVITPKNKKYTLSIGVLNSQNEFVDITQSLVRWDDNQNIINTSNLSDLQKFNTGYFIMEGEKITLENTINDNTLLSEREADLLLMKANTYAYKLVGPLYIQAKHNHPDNFEYNIYGTYKDKTADLYIEATITYNCPDGCPDKDSVNDDNYLTYEVGKVKSDFFDFIKVDSNTLIYREVQKDPDYEKKGWVTTYNPSTNTYKTTVVKHYTYNNNRGTDNILTYVIGVRSLPNQGDSAIDYKYYLRGLSTKGTIDLSKLGSGEVNLLGWRFSNNFAEGIGTLAYMFEAYPKYGQKLTNLTFIFQDVTGGGQIPISASLNNGRSNLQLNWKELGLNPRTLYTVDIYYHDSLKGTDTSCPPGTNTALDHREFYLTTNLFNPAYPARGNNEQFISDFGWPDKTGNKETDQFIFEIEKLATNDWLDQKERRTISNFLKIPVSLKEAPTISVDTKYGSIEGKYLSEIDSNLYLESTNSYGITTTVNGQLGFNEDLYPAYVEIDNESESTIEVRFEKINGTLVDNVDTTDPSNTLRFRHNIADTLQLNPISVNIGKSGNSSKTFRIYEQYIPESKWQSLDITNAFNSVANIVEKYQDTLIQKNPEAAICGYCWTDRGGKSPGMKIVAVKYNQSTGKFAYTQTDGVSFFQTPDDHEGKNLWYHVSFTDFMDEFQDEFKSDNPFIFGITPGVLHDDSGIGSVKHLTSHGFSSIRHSKDTVGDGKLYWPAYSIVTIWTKGNKGQYVILDMYSIFYNSANSTQLLKSTENLKQVSQNITSKILYALYNLGYGNIHYCFDNQNVVRKEFYYKGSDYIRTFPYNFSIDILPELTLDKPDKVLKESNFPSQCLKFTTIIDENVDPLTITFTSNDKFADQVDQVLAAGTTLDSYDFKLGTLTDGEGNFLMKNKLYKEQDGQLYSVSNIPNLSFETYGNIRIPIFQSKDTYLNSTTKYLNSWVSSGENEEYTRISIDMTSIPVVQQFNGI